MSTALWSLPVPSSALLDGPTLAMRSQREVGIGFTYEGVDKPLVGALVLAGVEAFKLTHHHARGDWMLEAYGKLIDLGSTPWLTEVRTNLTAHAGETEGLKHLMINFDDGPCYEAICRWYHFEPGPT